MPPLRYYDLFISHVWRKEENSEYYRLRDLLSAAPNFLWRDYSVPEHDPLETKTDTQLEQKLSEQIRQVSCFVVVAGMYVNHRKWIQKEIDIARGYRKPLVAVIPWGQERIPQDLQTNAQELVGWSTSSLVSAIRRHSI